MTYMRHPLSGIDSLDAVKAYPFPRLGCAKKRRSIRSIP